jgi:hypothetical protein
MRQTLNDRTRGRAHITSEPEGNGKGSGNGQGTSSFSGAGIGAGAGPHVLLDEQARAAIRLPSALRRVPTEQIASVLPPSSDPQAGSLALGRVERIGKNTRLELASGRHGGLHEGDVLAMVFGNRYATNQFEGYARADGDACDLLSMGGLCGLVASKHDSMPDPTKLRLLGMLGDVDGIPLHVRDFSLPPVRERRRDGRPRMTVVCGTTMDAGKTHTVISLLLGLTRGKHPSAAIKLTGTACGRDTWKMYDAGARPALDFVDGGYASTYQTSLGELMELYDLLMGHACAAGAEHVVIEIADGLLQQETCALLSHAPFRASVDTWVLAAGDPVAAAGAVSVLAKGGICPVVISGLLTRSTLAMREAEAATGIRCMSAAELQLGALNHLLCLTVHPAAAATNSAAAPHERIAVA